MGDEETALVRAVLADPGDDAPRLIYRDWLDERGRWAYETVLALVLAYPEADGPRLLAARWWEENGESERAEFVRVQCGIASWEPPYSPWCGRCGWAYEQCQCGPVRKWPPEQIRLEALRRREGELLGVPMSDTRSVTYPVWSFFDRLPGDPAFQYAFRRGFVQAVTCTAADWLEHGDAVVAAMPVEEVSLTTVPPQPDRAETLLHEAWPRVKHWHLPRIIEPSRTHGAPWQQILGMTIRDIVRSRRDER